MTDPNVQLKVVAHLSSDQFQDEDDIPSLEDDSHVYYPALREEEDWKTSEYAELALAIESGELDPTERHFFILNRPEPDAKLRLEAIRQNFLPM